MTGPDTPRIVMHIDIKAKKRHQALMKIAKTIRDHSNNTIQTTVRAGRRDYMILQRPKGSATPWWEIPPEVIRQKILEFKIGDYENIFNEINDDENKEKEDKQEIKEIIKDLKSTTKN